MARLKEIAIGRGGDSFLFDPESIQEKPGYNVRDMESPETQAHVRRMADAIHAGGTSSFPPITVQQAEDGNLYVIAGYCRRRAFVLAKQEGAPIKGIRAIAAAQRNDAELTLDLLQSNDGLPLKPMEKARAMQRLVSFQWTTTDIAKRLGVSHTTVNNNLALLDAPAEAVELVEQGKVSATLAVETVKKDGALIGTQKLKQGVGRAAEAGKEKATRKHIEQPAKPRLARILDEICNVIGVSNENYEDLPNLLRQRLTNPTEAGTAC